MNAYIWTLALGPNMSTCVSTVVNHCLGSELLKQHFPAGGKITDSVRFYAIKVSTVNNAQLNKASKIKLKLDIIHLKLGIIHPQGKLIVSYVAKYKFIKSKRIKCFTV